MGASKPSNYGQYLKWSDTEGYETGTLKLEDDAAHVNMDGDWHMPTSSQCQELIDNTTTAWTTSDGVSGMTFTSNKDTSKFIFIPAAGAYSNDEQVYDVGNIGSIWSSTISDFQENYGMKLDIDSSGAFLDTYGLPSYFLRSVRGVIG